MTKAEKILPVIICFLLIMIIVLFGFEIHKNIFCFNNPTKLQCIINRN